MQQQQQQLQQELLDDRFVWELVLVHWTKPDIVSACSVLCCSKAMAQAVHKHWAGKSHDSPLPCAADSAYIMVKLLGAFEKGP